MDVRRKQRAGWYLRCEATGSSREAPQSSGVFQPSDYHLFGPIKLHFKDVRHENDNELKAAVKSWLRQQPQKFYCKGIVDLMQRWAEPSQGEKNLLRVED